MSAPVWVVRMQWTQHFERPGVVLAVGFCLALVLQKQQAGHAPCTGAYSLCFKFLLPSPSPPRKPGSIQKPPPGAWLNAPGPTGSPRHHLSPLSFCFGVLRQTTWRQYMAFCGCSIFLCLNFPMFIFTFSFPSHDNKLCHLGD